MISRYAGKVSCPLGLPALLCSALASPVIDQWIAEIERLDGSRVLLARVELTPDNRQVRLAGGTRHEALFAEFLQQGSFVRQLLSAHALTVSRPASEGPQHLIFLNMSRLTDFQDSEDALISHELGHAWLRARGYPPSAGGGCLTIHATDAVQHILIRAEMERRGIDARAPWIRTLNRALDEWKIRPLPANLPWCDRVQAASQWIDVRLALTSETWARKDEYESLLASRYPDLAHVVHGLSDYLRPIDVEDAGTYSEALDHVTLGLAGLRELTSPLKTNQ